MNLDELKTAWKCQDKPDFAQLDPDELDQYLKAEQVRFSRVMLWTDIFVVAALGSAAVYFFVVYSGMKIVWPSYLAVILLLGAAFYLPWRNRQRRKTEKRFDHSLRDELRKNRAQLASQIRFSVWSGIWVYILPLITALCLLHWQTYLNGRGGIDSLRENLLSDILLGLFVYGVFWLSARKMRKDKRKIDLELEALGCPEPEEKTPMIHHITRTLLAIVVFGLCGYLIVQICTGAPGAGTPRPGTPIQSAPAFDQLGSLGEQETRQIDEWLEAFRKGGDYPSLSVAIVGDGRVLYQGAVGYADLKSQREATPETLWHVASVTKAFTSALAAKLHANSVIDLDRPVTDYLPEGVSISKTPHRGATITLRQLASHTSGLPRGVPGDVQSIDWRYALEPERLYKLLGGVELQFDPGSGKEYSNLGTGLLGHALERAAGIPFDRLLKDEVLAPLGMTRSGISLADEHHDLLATGYGEGSPREPRTHSFRRRLAPSGGLITSVAELSRFLLAQMPGSFQEESPFTGPMLADLHTPVKLSDGSDGENALGWRVKEGDSIGRYLEKNGGRSNAKAWIGFSPNAGVGVAVMVNCGDAPVEQIGYWLLERAAPDADPSKFDRTPLFAKVAPYTGVRWGTDPDSNQPTVRVRGKWLRLTAVDGIPIDRLMQTARESFGDRARMRFTEDLVEVLAAAGHHPGWSVTLMLDRDDGKGPVPFEEEMTSEKREAARAYR